MISKIDKNEIRKSRHERMRNKIVGTAERPRLNIYRSLSNIYVQLIDDVAGHTLVAASTMDKEIKAKASEMSKSEASKLVGELTAKRAKEKGIESVVFDRGGYLYTGRVAAVATGARDGGLRF